MKKVLLTAFDPVAENFKILLLFCFLFLALQRTVYGQAGTIALTQSPMSPNSASLGKFVEVPVGYYSGVPNISVPLYKLDAKGLSIPISIDYNASGIKVRDIPGAVGTGWSLNAGGVITRIVRGFPDDHDPQIVASYDYEDYLDSIMRMRIRDSHGDFFNSFTEIERNTILFGQPGCDEDPIYGYSGIRSQTEIDIFYFNFLGNTGQFTFTNTGKPMLLSDNDLKIEFIDRKFKITDGKGIQYFFDSTEQTIDETSEVSGMRMYNSALYLSKIYSPTTNETVTFTYKRYWNHKLYHSAYQNSSANSTRVDKLRSDTWPYSDPNVCVPLGGGTYGGTYAYGNAIFIDEINFDNKKVKFYGDTTRTDLFKYKLDSIKVSCDNELIRKIKFDYGYFNSGSGTVFNKKLRLDSLTVSDQVYRFSYLDSLHGRGIPSVETYGQDLWGYYNGEDDAGQAIPYYKMYDTWPDPNLFFYITNINSAVFNPDYKYAQIGTLQSIQYPTGGKAVFEYEGNDYSKYPFSNYPAYNIETDPGVPFKFQSAIYRSAGTATDPYGYGSSSYETRERKFVIHKNQTVALRVSLGMVGDISYDDYMEWIYGNPSEATATLKKYNETTGEYDVVESFLVSPLDSIGEINYWETVGWEGYMLQDRNVQLTEGSYKLEITLNGWFLSGIIEIFSDFPYKKTSDIFNAGGIRIKKIQFISGTGTDSSFVKTYDYLSDSLSSGVLESPFAEFTTSFHLGPEVSTGFFNVCHYIDITAQPIIPLGNAQGGVVGYSKVTENREDNSKTVYYFTTGMEETYPYELFRDQFSGYRTRIVEDNSWKRGLNRQTDFYNSSNQLVKQNFSRHDFQYGIIGDTSISIIFENVYPMINSGAFLYLESTPTYIYKLDRHALKTIDSTIQYSNGGNIIDVTKYEYNINPYTHLKKQISKTSNGEYLVTNFKYPLDYSVGGSPSDGTAISIKNLLDKHVISPVIEKYVEKKDANGNNTRVVSGQYVRYKSSIPLPDTVFNLALVEGISSYQAATITGNSSNKDSHYKPLYLFDNYDAYGGVTQQSKNVNTKEVILWGYKHQYIVARVIGSTYNTVLSYVDTTILNNPSSESAVLTELSKIRSALTGSSAQVYTYAYRPLVGMTASVDPEGRKTSYEYDSVGRLWLIKDQDGRIIKKICYNYSGQPEDCN